MNVKIAVTFLNPGQEIAVCSVPMARLFARLCKEKGTVAAKMKKTYE